VVLALLLVYTEQLTSMRVCRCLDAEGAERLALYEDGVAAGSTVQELGGGTVLAPETLAPTGASFEVSQLLAPVDPCNILCIGINYLKHYEEGAKKRGVPMPQQVTMLLQFSRCSSRCRSYTC